MPEFAKYRSQFPFDEVKPPPVGSASHSFLCNWNVKLELYGECNLGYIILPYYLLVSPHPVSYKEEIVLEKDGYGKDIEISKVVYPVYSFDFLVDTSLERQLYTMIYSSRELKLTNNKTSPNSIIIRNVSLTTEDVGNNLYRATLTYQTDESGLAAYGLNICCDSIYDATGGPEPPPPDDPYDCALMVVAANLSGTDINLSVVGAPSVINSVWTYAPAGGGAPVLIGNNLTATNTIGYGTYTINVTSGNCSKTVSVVYSDPCTLFDVTLSAEGAVITATIDGPHSPADSYAWEYATEADPDTFTSLPHTASVISVSDSGYYKVTATKGTCQPRTDIIHIAEGQICDLEGEILTEGNVLTWHSLEVPEVLPTSYQWAADLGDGNGMQDIPGATAIDHTALATGMYYVTVVYENGCEVVHSKLHIMCADCAAFDVEISNAGDVITATVAGCGEPDYYWYAINTDGSKIMVGTNSPTFTLPNDGGYLLAVCCADCEAKIYLILKSGGQITITDSKLSDTIAWGG